MCYEILITPWLDAKKSATPIRFEVFVNEQNVPESMEIDEDDENAWHALVIAQGLPIGTARLVIENTSSNRLQIGRIGRMAVLKSFRGQGAGKRLMEALIQFGSEMSIRQYYLHAQLTAQDFYKGFGFVSEGEIFEEAGILHQSMRLKI